MAIFRRRKPRACFFCLSPDERPAHTREHGVGALGANVNVNVASSSAASSSAWRCAACGCWNVRDRNGVIVSDLPAMHNSSLNGDSFALRGKAPANRLPSSSASTPFCRDCITNQTLVMNLLGNYLPDESDPAYATLEAELPNYIASLHERYPPVCTSCQPAVDEALKRSDQRAQSEAWGRALRRGRAQEASPAQRLTAFEVGVWRARGIAWMVDAALSWGLGVAAWMWPDLLAETVNSRVLGLRATTALLFLRGVSILWAVWDPTWLRRARGGDNVRVEGRSTWVTAMLVILCLRAGAAVYLTMWRRDTTKAPTVLVHTAISDAIAVVVSLSQLKLSAPVQLTLVRPVQSVSTPTQATRPTVSLSALSLDPSPTPPPAPVFGQPSLARPQPPRDESEPMDWEPTPGASTPDERSDWDTFGVGQQRMFPNGTANDETGLESLLAGWGISTGAAAPKTPSQPLPMAPLAPSQGLVLDDALVRKFRLILLALRCVALAAAVACVAVKLRLEDIAAPALRALLGLEAAASALALIVCLVSRSGRFIPLAAVVLASDAAVRTSALVSTAIPSSLPHEALAWAGPEIACAAWAVLDALVLAAT